VLRATTDSHNRFDLDEVWDSFSDNERLRVEATVARVDVDAGSLLDVGAGDGRLTRRLVEATPHTVALDFSRASLGRAADLRLRVRGSVLTLPFGDASFDMVLATEVLEHLSDADRRSAVRELVRVTRKRVLVTVPFLETLAEEMCQCERCQSVFHAYGHTRAFTRADLASLDNDLVVELIETIVPIRKVRPLRVLRWLQLRIGKTYRYDTSARCPACGGAARADTGNVVGTILRILCDRVDRIFPLREPGWLLAVYRRRNT
jgi:ubiquinone/menaquinone biosynthesis C-methylase UbiE